MTTKEKIEVMKHFENGGVVEWRYLENKVWSVAGTPSWNWQDKEYRTKEVPKKTKIVFEYFIKYKGINTFVICDRLYTEEEAKNELSWDYTKTGRQFEVEA